MEPTLNDIDEMIVHEKMQAALEHQNEAWADGMADGIEPEIIADAGRAPGECAAQLVAAAELAIGFREQQQAAIVLDGDPVVAARPAFGREPQIAAVDVEDARDRSAQLRIEVGKFQIAVERVGGEVPFQAAGQARRRGVARLATQRWRYGGAEDQRRRRDDPPHIPDRQAFQRHGPLRE